MKVHRSLLCATVLPLFAQVQQEPVAELRLPDFFERGFGPEASVIDIPPRPLERLEIEVLHSQSRNIQAGAITVRINGKGAGNVLSRRPSERGLVLSISPEFLAMRPDMLMDPVENLIELAAKDRTGREYYQNWLVRSNSAGRNPYFAYASAVSPDDRRGIPPDLQMDQPAAPVVLEVAQQTAVVRLKGVVASGASGVSVTLNGREWLRPLDKPAALFDEQITVTRQIQQLVIEARDKSGNRASVTIPVIAKSRTQRPARASGGRYAIVIGVTRFGPGGAKRPETPPVLAGASGDAKIFADQLERKAGFAKENIRLLVDEDATLEQLRAALSSFVAKAAADDLMMIYIAAHGVQGKQNPNQLHLALHGTMLHQLAATALALDELELLLNRHLRSRNAFLLFDVGHRMESEYSFPGKNAINTYLLKLFSEQSGRAVLASGGCDQISILRKTAGPASRAFTQRLVEALGGAADLNGDRVVTADEAFSYVTQQVRADSEGKQVPRFRISAQANSAPISIASEPRK